MKLTLPSSTGLANNMKSFRHFQILAIVAIASFLGHSAQASDTWIGASGGDWGTGGNWSPTGVPGSTATVVFNSAISSVSVASAESVESISFDTSAGSITIGSTGGGVLTLASGGTTQMLNTLTGSGLTETIDAPIRMGNETFSNGYTDNTSTLNFGGPITSSATSGTTTLTLSGVNAGANTISGAISNGTGTNAVALTKSGLGTWVLAGANTYTGATTVNSGTLELNFTGSNTGDACLSSSSALVLSGGTFSILGTNTAGQTTSQSVAGLTLNPGGATSAIVDTVGGSGLSSSLALNGITRATGGTVDFTLPATGSITTTTANANFTGGQQTILGGYATVGGNTWAVSGSGATPGAISGLATGSYSTTFTAAEDVDAQTGTTAVSGGSTLTINSLRFNSAGAYTVNITSPTTTLAIATGGILETSNVGSNAVSINGNTLETGNGTDLVVDQNNTLGTLTINSQIKGAFALTKSGAGTLILSALNVYTGQTIVTGGTLSIASTGSVDNTGGTLVFGGTFSLAGSMGGSSITTEANGTGIFSEASTGSIGNFATTFAQKSAGTSVLAGSNSYTGATTVTAGVLSIQSNGALGTGAGAATSGVTVSSGAALQIQNNISTTTAVGLTLNGAGLATAPDGALDNVSGTNNYTGLVTLGSASTISSDSGMLNLTNTGTIFGTTTGFGLTLTGSGNGSIAGIINGGTSSASGAGTLTKSGTGTWTLSGANTYSGNTTVSGGNLQLLSAAVGSTSSATGTGAVALSGGTTTTISGTGQALGAVTVTAGSRLAPGVNTGGGNGNFGAVGTLGVGTTGGLTLTNANLDFDLGTTNTAGQSDVITTAALSLGTLTFNLSGTTLQTDVLYDLINDTSETGFSSATINTNFLGALAGDYTAQYSIVGGTDGTDLDVMFTAIAAPEPSTWAMMLGGLALLIVWQRRKSRQG